MLGLHLGCVRTGRVGGLATELTALLRPWEVSYGNNEETAIDQYMLH